MPAKIFKDKVIDRDIVKIKFRIITWNLDKSKLNKLWIVKTLKFFIYIKNKVVNIILDSKAEINIMLLHIAQALELKIWTNILISIREAGDKKSSFIRYVSDIQIRVRNIIV